MTSALEARWPGFHRPPGSSSATAGAPEQEPPALWALDPLTCTSEVNTHSLLCQNSSTRRPGRGGGRGCLPTLLRQDEARRRGCAGPACSGSLISQARLWELAPGSLRPPHRAEPAGKPGCGQQAQTPSCSTPPFCSHSEGAGPSGDPGSECSGVLHLHFPGQTHPEIRGKLPRFL